MKSAKLNLSALDRKIEILEYSESYPELYRLEQNRVLEMLGGKIDAIEHVGSTSVPGLVGKPTIDILIRLNSNVSLDESVQLIEGVGYMFIPELLAYRPERRIFWRGEGNTHKFHIHAVGLLSQDWYKIIKFRDRLREDVGAREEYATLKIELARTHVTNISDYVLGKDEFYCRITSA